MKNVIWATVFTVGIVLNLAFLAASLQSGGYRKLQAAIDACAAVVCVIAALYFWRLT